MSPLRPAGPIVVTLGDPAGIGPEVALKALDAWWVTRRWPAAGVALVGAPATWHTALAWTSPEFRQFMVTHGHACTLAEAPAAVAEAARTPGPRLTHVDPDPGRAPVPLGAPSAQSGQAAFAALEAAYSIIDGRLKSGASLASAGALVTAPISKEALQLAGVPYFDHTTWLAARTGRRSIMSFVGAGMRVALATVHIGLAKVPTALTVTDLGWLIATAGADLGSRERLAAPIRVAVCGLNPHAGEHGLFGREDDEIVRPAVELAQRTPTPIPLAVSGPWPADTIFWRARQGEFDVVIALYHDQGLVAIKTVDFHGAVNATLNLPFVRTSPDHGTAFDIAGRGIANAQSMIAALNLAERWTAG